VGRGEGAQFFRPSGEGLKERKKVALNFVDRERQEEYGSKTGTGDEKKSRATSNWLN